MSQKSVLCGSLLYRNLRHDVFHTHTQVSNEVSNVKQNARKVNKVRRGKSVVHVGIVECVVRSCVVFGSRASTAACSHAVIPVQEVGKTKGQQRPTQCCRRCCRRVIGVAVCNGQKFSIPGCIPLLSHTVQGWKAAAPPSQKRQSLASDGGARQPEAKRVAQAEAVVAAKERMEKTTSTAPASTKPGRSLGA